MKKTDLIIKAGKLLTLDADEQILDEHCLVVHGGRIVDILPSDAAAELYDAERISDCSDQLLMPGLVNAHTHLPMNLMRGLAGDLPLKTWLEEHIWPAEQHFLSEEFVAAGTRLALAESILGGVTCCNDMYFFPETVAAQALQAGVRCSVGMLILDFPSAWAKNAEDYLKKGLELRDRLRGEPLASTTFAPHAPYTVATEMLEKIAVLSAELDVPVHMHVHETAQEVRDFEKSQGCRPLQHLEQIGLLNPSLLAVHMTQLTPDEIDRVANSGAQIVHCPESNMKLASGAAPITALMSKGVNIAIGTDGAASNNDLDMFTETRSAAFLAKLHSGDAASVTAREAVRMMTINGAKALGLANEIGSLETGKAADVISININNINAIPNFDTYTQLVYSTDRASVQNVWINGQQVLDQRRLTTLDTETIQRETKHYEQLIRSRQHSPQTI